MENASIRDLELCEFNRVLPIISKVIMIEGELKKLVEQQVQLQKEIKQKEASPESLNTTIEEGKMKEIMKRRKELGDYKEKLKELVSNIVSFAFDDGYLFIQKDEIKGNFVKEYIYLLVNIELESNEYLTVDRLFAERAELILLLYEKYGREQEKLIYEIANLDRDDELGGVFTDYFKL